MGSKRTATIVNGKHINKKHLPIPHILVAGSVLLGLWPIHLPAHEILAAGPDVSAANPAQNSGDPDPTPVPPADQPPGAQPTSVRLPEHARYPLALHTSAQLTMSLAVMGIVPESVSINLEDPTRDSNQIIFADDVSVPPGIYHHEMFLGIVQRMGEDLAAELVLGEHTVFSWPSIPQIRFQIQSLARMELGFPNPMSLPDSKLRAEIPEAEFVFYEGLKKDLATRAEEKAWEILKRNGEFLRQTTLALESRGELSKEGLLNLIEAHWSFQNYPLDLQSKTPSFVSACHALLEEFRSRQDPFLKRPGPVSPGTYL